MPDIFFFFLVLVKGNDAHLFPLKSSHGRRERDRHAVLECAMQCKRGDRHERSRHHNSSFALCFDVVSLVESSEKEWS